MKDRSTTLRFVGHAIVTADGMIADEAGEMTGALRNEADWSAFQAALDAAAIVVLGKLGHDRHPNPGRRRLVLTRTVEALEPCSRDTRATLWNPAGLPFASVAERLDLRSGTVAVTGGTGIFDHFLPMYDRFDLAEAHGYVLPGGTPCFGAGHPRSILAAAGLKPGTAHLIDAAAGVTMTHWDRAG